MVEPLKLYWWRGEGAHDPSKRNFGDYLSPLIVEMVSGRPVIHADPSRADMIAIGSILSRERKAKRFLVPRRLHIWGAGTDSQERRFSARHYYHAVRGAKTAAQILAAGVNPALGDPGLLVDDWFGGKPRPSKKYTVGLIPHFVDQGHSAVAMVANRLNAKIIDVFAPVGEVVSQIRACRFVLSSSMHGLIVADSFAIPNRRIIFSSGVISDYKFEDYYSAFGLDEPEFFMPESVLSPGWSLEEIEDGYVRPCLDEIKQGLYSAFPDVLRA